MTPLLIEEEKIVYFPDGPRMTKGSYHSVMDTNYGGSPTAPKSIHVAWVPRPMLGWSFQPAAIGSSWIAKESI